MPGSFPRLLPRLILTLCVLATPCLATEDVDNTTPTGWTWYYNLTPASVGTVLAGGQRLVDLEVESVSPLRFTIATVTNSGSYGKGWWWYYGLTFSDLGNVLAANNARLIDLEPYEDGGSIRYAAVMVSNTGADAKAWWYVISTDKADVDNTISATNSRIVDLERKTLLGQTWYSAVLISNTGADARPWVWWLGVSSSFLSSQVATGLRIVDLEPRPNGTFDAVLVDNPGDTYWWWYLGQSEAQLSAKIAQTGSRVQDIRRVGSSFHAMLLNNSNALTTRVGEILRDTTDGTSGLYLREINGSVRAALQEGFPFEPASTIKTLMHAHAMRAVSDGTASLAEQLVVNTGLGGPGLSDSCPNDTLPVLQDMSSVLEDMMWESDNARTKAIADRFGVDAINDTADALGMPDSQILHTLGCGGPPPNALTLLDGAALHTQVANGYLGPWRQAFYDHMLTSVDDYGDGLLGVIIDQEAAAAGLPALVQSDFESRLAMAYKGGNYTVGGLEYWSGLAWVRIPFLSGNSVVEREYATGVFIHAATDLDDAKAALIEASAELLRDELRAAMLSWAEADGAWVDIGGGIAGTGDMELSGVGSLVGGTLTSTTLSDAAPNSVASFVLGLTHLDAPFKGGVWGPFPDVLVPGIPTGPQGTIELPVAWPVGLPGGAQVFVQWWMADPGAPLGFAGSNTIRGTTP